MPRVKNQISVDRYTIISLDSPIPDGWRKKVVIDGVEYETEIVYDMGDSIAIVGNGSFIGKEVQSFV